MRLVTHAPAQAGGVTLHVEQNTPRPGVVLLQALQQQTGQPSIQLRVRQAVDNRGADSLRQQEFTLHHIESSGAFRVNGLEPFQPVFVRTMLLGDLCKHLARRCRHPLERSCADLAAALEFGREETPLSTSSSSSL